MLLNLYNLKAMLNHGYNHHHIQPSDVPFITGYNAFSDLSVGFANNLINSQKVLYYDNYLISSIIV